MGDKKSWSEIKKIIEEVRNAPKNQNPILGVYIYFSGKPKKKWQVHYFDLPDVRRFHFVKFK